LKIIFGKPYITEKEIEEVIDSLKTGWIGKGPKTARFEKMFTEYSGAKYAVALNSCTAALYISLRFFNIKEGDEVITTPLTFAATANVIENCDAKTIFVDVEKNSGCINPDLIEEKITKNTKAIIPVHYCGYPCEIEKIIKIAKKYKLKVIFDAAHCIEGKYRNKHIANFGDAVCFSFYATKNITTAEGGMLCTNNRKLYEYAKLFSTQGLSSDAWTRSKQKDKYYSVILAGMKFNMCDLQAAIGIQQLLKIEKLYQIRLRQWQRYNLELKETGLILPLMPDEKIKRHSLHLYTILIDKKRCGISRDELKKELEKSGIGTGIHFISLHNHKYYKKKYNLKRSDFPNANYFSNTTLSLPIGPALTEKEQNYIIKMIRNYVSFSNNTSI